MSLSIEEIRENYSKFPDYKIEKIATENTSSLRPEVVEVLKTEIKKRKLNPNLLGSVAIQLEPISKKDIQSLKNKITKTHCPTCTSQNNDLIAVQVLETISPLFVTISTERIYIACPSCARKEKTNSIIKTLLLGWWSPWGLLYYTPKTLIKSLLTNNKIEENSPLFLDAFVLQNIGSIKAIEDNYNQLTLFLQKHNSTK